MIFRNDTRKRKIWSCNTIGDSWPLCSNQRKSTEMTEYRQMVMGQSVVCPESDVAACLRRCTPQVQEPSRSQSNGALGYNRASKVAHAAFHLADVIERHIARVLCFMKVAEIRCQAKCCVAGENRVDGRFVVLQNLVQNRDRTPVLTNTSY